MTTLRRRVEQLEAKRKAIETADGGTIYYVVFPHGIRALCPS